MHQNLTVHRRLTLFASLALLLSGLCPQLPGAQIYLPGAAAGDRMAWFNEARFGMFIHWGIYAVPAGQWHGQTNFGEWFQLETKMPSAEYEQFAAQFNPVEFDAREWVRIAKDAGMKYIVITSKHHDGFCMFDTKLTGYNIVQATPFKRDPMKELSAACRAAGLKFCFYYSVPDWHSSDFPAKYSQRGFHGAPNPDADLDRYVAYVKGQIRELLTGYGPISILWFDGGGSFKQEGQADRVRLMHSQEIIDLIHELQPQCLVNNRLWLPADYGTPEQKIPGLRPTNSFEVCMTLNRHWGFNKNDHDWKQPRQVIENLVDIASKGGNYLLNVGPRPEGVIPADSVRILKAVGDWMKVNGDSIYGTSASPLETTPAWGRVTQKGSVLYLHVFDWPANRALTLQGVSARRAYLLADPAKKALKLENSGGTLTLSLPAAAPDNTDSVIVAEGE
jgi:alpha-L-fucosidase